MIQKITRCPECNGIDVSITDSDGGTITIQCRDCGKGIKLVPMTSVADIVAIMDDPTITVSGLIGFSISKEDKEDSR